MKSIFTALDKFADRVTKGVYYNKMLDKKGDFDRKLTGTDEQKRKFIPMAIPRGVAKAVIFQYGILAGIMADSVANAKAFSKDEEATKTQKVRKWAVLPIKLAALGALEVSNLIVLPVILAIGITYGVKGLIHFKKNSVEMI